MSGRWLKASVASAAAQLTRMACGLLVLKIVVTQLGVEGVGMLGHFMSLLSILFVFAGGGIGIGIAKYVAQYESLRTELAAFLSAAWSYSLAASAIIAVLFLAGAKPMSELLFGVPTYQDMIMFVGVAQFAFAYINFANGVVNGLRETQAFSRITIIGCVLGVAPCYYLVSKFHLEGAVVALVLVQAGMLLPAAREFRKLFHRFAPEIRATRGQARDLGRFSLMQLFSVATMPVAEIYIRTELANISGWEMAGTWQGVQRLSYACLSLFTSFLAVYYMPTLSAMTERRTIVRYVLRTMGGIVLAFGLGACTIYILRDFVFALLLSKDFAIAPDLLRYQLAGDACRIAAYVIGFLAVAKAATRIYVISELVQSGLYVTLFSAMLHVAGGKGVFLAYALSNFAYLALSLVALTVYARSPQQAKC